MSPQTPAPQPRPPGTPEPVRPRPDALLEGLASGRRADRLTHVHHRPERTAVEGIWPAWLTPSLYAALTQSGVVGPWAHQSEAAEAAHRGEHVVLSTGTASGKSLGFLMPVLSDVIEGSGHPSGRGVTALYLAPTKALAADQLAAITRLALPGVRAATYDGDTPLDERRWVREHASYMLTNPDLVHHSLLPGHERWAAFLRALRYVVVDECHIYRGVFGAHVSAVLRRLRRVAARYGSAPTFVLASATVAEPALHAQRLIGMPVRAVTADGSPRASLTMGLWEPALKEPDDGPPRRRSAVAETADLLADLVAADAQTVAFARSRAGVEVVAAMARERLESIRPDAVSRVAAYRGGYLPEDRRDIERRLRDRSILGLAATNALELGIDVRGLDAVLLAGWPGTRASLWQQVGRAGRSGSAALAMFVAADDPLDTYLVHHPEVLFDRPVEATVCDPGNPHILAPHLAAAAAELPVTEADETYFGPAMVPLLAALAEAGILRRRPSGWYWSRADRPTEHLTLRGLEGTVQIVEAVTGRVIGTVDEVAAHRQVHTGAVHIHQGQPYVVTELDLAAGHALVTPGDPGWSTQARSVSAFDIVRPEAEHVWGPVGCFFGTVAVRTQVTSFLRRLPTGEVLGEHPLDLPVRTLDTRAVWWTFAPEVLEAAGLAASDIPGAAHAAEHAAIGMLPLVASADRWDIGGVSTALHPDTGLPTILIYDGYPGGAGFAERGFAVAPAWLAATHAAIAACGCSHGCPSCVQSPKCGNGNEPLDKAGALTLLEVALAARA